MARETWRKQAGAVIEAAARKWLEERGLGLRALHTLGGEEKRELLKVISDAYPWGIRANHPYKAWLSAVSDFRKHLGEPVAPAPTEGLFAQL